MGGHIVMTAALAALLATATPTPPPTVDYWRTPFWATVAAAGTAAMETARAADTAEAHAWASQAAHARGTPWGYPNFTTTPTTEPTPTLAPAPTATAAPSRRPRPTPKPTRSPQPTATQRPAATVTSTPAPVVLEVGAWLPFAWSPRR